MIRLFLIPAVLMTSGCLLDRDPPRTQTAPVVRCHPQDYDCRQYQQEQRRIQQARQNEARMRNRTVTILSAPKCRSFAPRDATFLFPTGNPVRSAGPARKSSGASSSSAVPVSDVCRDTDSVTAPVSVVNDRVRRNLINRATENIVRRSCMEAFRGSGSYAAMGMCGDGTQFGSAVLGGGM